MVDKEYPINKFVSRFNIGENSKDLPIVSKILKQLTPEKIEAEVEEIKKIKLPPELQKWVKEYEKVGERDEFIWKWTYLGMQKVTLPSVLKEYKELVLVIKTVSIILNTLIDDIADKQKNKQLLNAALNICSFQEDIQTDFSHFSEKEKNYLILIKELWKFLNKTIKKSPRHEEFREFFKYDYQQFFNNMNYSYLINKEPRFINLTECKIYSAHNMQGIIVLIIDLMYSSKLRDEEFGSLREIAWNAQRMGRIGNSISTWEREVYENDFSSEVLAYVIKNDFLHIEDLKNKNKEEIISKIKQSKAEKYLFKDWEKNYKKIKSFDRRIKSFNVQKLLFGLENLMFMHLISRGLK